MRKLIGTFTLVLMALGLLVSPVSAYTLNSDGTGFVGKGEVQLVSGLNNQQVQNATVSFEAVTTTVTEVSWECTNTRNETIQERERTTTTESTAVVSSQARIKNQITGYNLLGFGSSSSSTTTEGPAVNTCPTNWVLTSPAGDPVVVDSSSQLYTYVNGAQYLLP
jgi:hypothetical protein